MSQLWAIATGVLLLVNVLLAVLLWRSLRGKETSKPAAAVAVEAPKQGGRNVLTGELRSYAALGTFMAESNRIADLGWSRPQFDAFLEGFRSSYDGKGFPMDDDAKHLQGEISERVQGMLAAERPNPIDDYFRTLREKEGVQKTPSGLHYRVTEAGEGPKAKASDTVVISFAARLPDGQALPPLTRVRLKTSVHDLLPGLAEGVQLLSVGGKALVYLPPALAFSERDWPPDLPKNVPLAFFLELHEIINDRTRD
jgi:FKBP-type peptidyl-prolyl cis-trans isomerase